MVSRERGEGVTNPVSRPMVHKLTRQVNNLFQKLCRNEGKNQPMEHFKGRFTYVQWRLKISELILKSML